MVGIYCRISKAKIKGQDVSIENQTAFGIEFAKSEGMQFKTFVDEGISGTGEDLAKRPGFVLLLDSIQKGIITKVYCYDQSRIERNNDVWNFFTHAMLKAGCMYYPNGKYLDLDKPENKLFTGIISLTNSFYASLTGKKVKMAINANAKKGKTHGITAYGYEKGDGGFFQINEEEAKVVNRIYKMSLDGIGTYTIAKKLNEDNIPCKFSRFNGQLKRKDKYTKNYTLFNKQDVRWRGNVIHDMITNPIYKGMREWNNEVIPIQPIIKEEFWQEVNDNLRINKKNVGKREEYHYLLNGLIFCEECGSEYRGKKRLKGRDNAYKCKGKNKHNIKCNSRGLNIVKLENFIIHHLFISKDLQNFLNGLSDNKNELDSLKSKLEKEKKELMYLHKVEDKTYKQLLDPDFEDDERIKTELKTTKKKIKDKEQTIAVLENRLIERDANSRIKRISSTINNFHLNASFEDIKRLVHSLVKKISIAHKLNANKKGGYFHVMIEYKGFNESSVFLTNWQAIKWTMVSYYRSQAISSNDLKEDQELIDYLLKSKGVKEENLPDFNGFETISGGNSAIILDKNELLNFD